MQPFERAKLLSKFAELLEKPDHQRAKAVARNGELIDPSVSRRP